jgi:hypothetical protein
VRLLLAISAIGACEADGLVVDPKKDTGVFRPCAIDYDVDVDTVLDPSICAIFSVDATIDIRDGATLTILAGTELRFEKSQGITVAGGRLILEGTKDRPVILTSIDPDPSAGSRWGGIAFLGDALPGSRLSHAIVRNAGTSEDDPSRGCVALEQTVSDAVTLEDVVLERCSGAGLSVDAEGVRIQGGSLELAESEVGLRFAPRNAGDVTAPLLYRRVDANVLTGGHVSRSARWIEQAIPWRVAADVSVEGPDDPVLTLDPGVHLTFSESTAFRVGDVDPGALVILGQMEAPVTLEGDGQSPWHGVIVGRAGRAAIDFAVVRGGGLSGPDVRGCLTILAATPVSIASSTFDACAQAAIAVLDPTFAFSILSKNRFTSAEVGLSLPAAVVGSVTEEQTYVGVGCNTVEGGDVPKSATWIRQPVPWKVRERVAVQGAGEPVLAIEPGSILQFEPGKWLQIGAGGELSAVGTDSNPILFEPSQRAWPGLLFGEAAAGTSKLDRVVLRGGGERVADIEGCLTVRGSARDRSVAVDRSTFEGCGQAGVAATDGEFQFASFAGNTFREMEIGLHLAASSVTSISTPQTFEGVRFNRIEATPILIDTTWWPQPIPWIMAGDLDIDGPSAPILNINPGTELLLEPSALFLVGTELGGGLVASGTGSIPVRFAGANMPPGYGDWHGIVFGPMTLPGSRLERVEIENGGRIDSSVRGAVTLDRTESRVQIANTWFSSSLGADLYVDCGSQPLLSGNTYSTAGLVLECP